MICMHTHIGVCFEFTIYPTITKLFDMLTVEMVLSIDSKRAHLHHGADVGLCRILVGTIYCFLLWTSDGDLCFLCAH